MGVRAEAGPEMQEVLEWLTGSLRDGDDVVALDEEETMTPREASRLLGMSRTHLYKLLDRSQIPSIRVGRDRRMKVLDVVAFDEYRQREKKELAERFAHRGRTRDAAVDEIIDHL